jgi:hypothetical protein
VTDNPNALNDPWRKLAAIRAQIALVQHNATELEQLGLTLSGRDLSDVDHADLVSYVIWISQFAGQNASVLANWGLGLIGYVEGSLRAAGLTPPRTVVPAEDVIPTDQPKRWWRRS